MQPDAVVAEIVEAIPDDAVRADVIVGDEVHVHAPPDPAVTPEHCAAAALVSAEEVAAAALGRIV